MQQTAASLSALSLAATGLCATALCVGQEPPAAPAGAPDSKRPWDSVAILLGVSESRGEVLVADARGTVVVLGLDKGEPLRVDSAAAEATRFDVSDEKGEKRIALFATPLSVSAGRITLIKGRRVVEVLGTQERILGEGAALEGCRNLVRAAGGDRFLAGAADGRLVGMGDDGKLRLREQGTGSLGPSAVSPDGRLAFIASKGEEWDVLPLPALEPAAHLANLLGYPPLLAFAASRSGRSVAVSHGVACRLKVHSVSEKGVVGDLRGAFKVDSPCLALAFADREDLIALGHLDGTVRIVDAPLSESPQTGMLKERAAWKDQTRPIRGVAFCRADRLLVSLAEDGTVVARACPEGTAIWQRAAFGSK